MAIDLIIRLLTKYDGKGGEQAKKDFEKLKSEIGGLAREVGGDIGLAMITDQMIDFGKEAVVAGGQSRIAESALLGLSGGSEQAAENMAAMSRATRDMISETEQMRIANQLLGMEIVSTDEEMEKVVNVSRRLGKEFRGLGAADAANEFAIMISNMSVARLDSFGISSGNVRKRIEELMASTEGMTREQAFFQATMKEADKTLSRLGPELTTTTDRVERLGASWDDLQTAVGRFGEEAGPGLFDTIITSADVLVDRLTEGVEAYDGLITRVASGLDRLNASGGQVLGTVLNIADAATSSMPALNAALNLGARVGLETQVRLAEETVEQAETTTNDLQSIEIEHGEEITGLKRDLARDLLDIQNDTAAELEDAAERLVDDLEDAEADHVDRLSDIRKGAAKERLSIERDLQKDLAKLDKDLKKNLAKSEENEARKITKTQKAAAKAEKRQRRIEQVDALADERLFQLQLQHLAADGEGIAIQQALERRAIEQEIAEEKAAVEQQIEREKRQDQIQSIREEGQERRSQMQQDAVERKALIEERNREELQALQEKTAEALATEAENYADRKADLQEHYADRAADIRAGEQEALEEIGHGLAETEDLTRSQLDELVQIGGKLGWETGAALAGGIKTGFEETSEIDRLLGAGGGNGATATGNTAGPMAGVFANEGIIPGPAGTPRAIIAHGGEAVVNPGGGSLGGGTIVIGDQSFIVTQAARLGAAINAQRARDMQMLVDQLSEALD